MEAKKKVKKVAPVYQGQLIGGLALEMGRVRRHKKLFDQAGFEITRGQKRGGSAARAYFVQVGGPTAEQVIKRIQPKRKNSMVRRAAGQPTFRQALAKAKEDALRKKPIAKKI